MSATMTKAAKKLETEWRFFEANRERLVAKGEGKFVLIRGRKIIGLYESKWDAIEQGYERFGNVPFFVKRIERVETPIYIVSSLIAI